MKKIVALLVLLTSALAWAGSVPRSHLVQAQDPKAVYSDPSKSVMVNPSHGTFTIALASNPSTGYSWFIESYDDDFMKLKDHQFIASDRELVGSAGMERWLFKVKKVAFVAPRLSTLKLRYARPWALKTDDKRVVFHIVSH